MKTARLVVFVALALCCASVTFGQALEWKRQFGTSEGDVGNSVSADGIGNVYITGQTYGSVDGINLGEQDAFLTKYDDAGTIQWSRQVGTSASDIGLGVSADILGNVFISGRTEGSLEGTNHGGTDAFLRMYDSDGVIKWTRQLGTIDFDIAHGVSADGLGNVYIAGSTGDDLAGSAGGSDAFLTKYNINGVHQWTEQFGTDGGEGGHGVSADGLGSVYVTGFTTRDLGGTNAGMLDVFLRKFDDAGAVEWTRQFGTSGDDDGQSVSADRLGNVYVSGFSRAAAGANVAGRADAFITKYDANGELDWMRQVGTAATDFGLGVSADGLGNAYISGWTNGSLGGEHAGGSDAFVSKYDPLGGLKWTRQLGTGAYDESHGVSADGFGSVYITGYTNGDLEGTSPGRQDAFLVKYIPEPTGFVLALLACAGLLFPRRR